MSMSNLKKGNWYKNLDNELYFRFLELDAFGDIYANETIIDGTWVRNTVCVGEIDSFPYEEAASPIPLKNRRIYNIPHQELEEGKWYFGSFWQVDSCAKYVYSDKAFAYSEHFYNKIYFKEKSVSGWSKDVYCEVPIEFLKTFLPEGHPDLKTSNNQINSQSNGKTNSNSKQDSESAITVSRKSPKIGEIKRTGTGGVYGRRARATIGRYNPQNKAINSRY